MKEKESFIRTGLSQTVASIEQRKNRNGPLGRRMSKFGPLLLALFLGVCFASHCEASTNFYVDPDWTGAHSGTASQPWPTLGSSQWATNTTTFTT